MAMSNASEFGGKRISSLFSSPDADVVFRSSDGILFNLHRKNLEIVTGGFAPPDIITLPGEEVPLQELSDTLELLFQFVYPSRHPDLVSLRFEPLARLAEAAEKYEVYPAMNICKLRMHSSLSTPAHALPVLSYATKHGYLDIADDAAPLCIGPSLVEVPRYLPGHFVLPWLQYVDAWIAVLRLSINYALSPSVRCSCSRWPLYSESILIKLGASPESLYKLDIIFPHTVAETCCQACIKVWRRAVVGHMRGIPKLRHFCASRT